MRLLTLILFAFSLLLPLAVHAETEAERSVLLVRQGTAALLRGKYDRAIKAYDQALSYDKLSPVRKASIHSDRGVALWRLKESARALTDFDKAIEINPQYPQVYNNKGNVLMDLNRHQEAIEAFGKAIELAPTYGAAYNNRGGAYYELGHIDEAIRDFSLAVRYLPVNAVPHNGRGRALLSKEHNYAALRDFSRAIRLNANYGMVYLSRARAYYNTREYKKAVKDYTRAISIAKDVPALHFERGRAYQKLSDYASAIADYTKVIDLVPGHLEAYSRRGLSFGLLKKYDEGINDVVKAIELDPTNIAGYLARGKVFKKLEKYDEALWDLNKVLEFGKEHAEALKLMAQIYEVRDEKDMALALYQRSLASDRFLTGTRQGLQRLTKTLPAYGAEPVGEVVRGWSLGRRSNGKHFIYNEKYPYFYGDIESYGSGEPLLLDWKALKGQWKGIGLLRYFAGTRPLDKGGIALEYTAIIDLKRARLKAIEPYKWGEAQAKWKWGNGHIVVTDPDGGISEVLLRTPRRVSSKARRSGGEFVPSPWGEVRRPARRSAYAKKRKRTKRKRRRKKEKNLLHWLFN